MLIDLLNSSNYLMVNRDAVRIFGLNTAVYCSELLTIYKKAVTKNKLYDDVYFKVDREYVQQMTSLEIKDQLKCDANLAKVNIIKASKDDPDIIYFDVEVFASLVSSEDVKLLNKVAAKVKVDNPRGTKQAARDRIIIALKNSIECRTPEVLKALKDWIDSIMADPNRYLSKQQVTAFKDRIDDYCNGDLAKALQIISIATIHTYVDCQWAINTYERGNKPQYQSAVASTVRTTEQKQTTEVGEELF